MLIAMPMPKYHQVYLVLREQLHEGKFSQGLPGEVALMQQFGVAPRVRHQMVQVVDLYRIV